MSQKSSWTTQELQIFLDSLKRFNRGASLSLLKTSEKIAGLLDGKSTIDVLEHMKQVYSKNVEMAIAKVKVSQPSPIQELQQNAISQRAHWTLEEIDIFNEGSKRFDSDKSLSLLMRSDKIAALLDRKSTIDVLERIKWSIIERFERCIVQAKASQPSDDLQQSDEDLLALTLGTGPYRKKRKTSDSHLIKKDLEDMQAALAVVSENMKLRLEGAENDRQRVDLVQKNLMQILRNLV